MLEFCVFLRKMNTYTVFKVANIEQVEDNKYFLSLEPRCGVDEKKAVVEAVIEDDMNLQFKKRKFVEIENSVACLLCRFESFQALNEDIALCPHSSQKRIKSMDAKRDYTCDVCGRVCDGRRGLGIHKTNHMKKNKKGECRGESHVENGLQ